MATVLSRGRPAVSRTTPGTLRLLMAALVLACLGWGVLAALTISQHADAAGQTVTAGEPLSLDAQQLYQSLADADVTVTTAFLYGHQQPYSARQRYQHDVAVAAGDLRAVTAAAGNSAVAADLATLDAGLPVYTGYVEDAEVYNAVNMPAGGSYIQVASEEMHLSLLPAAHNVYTQENAQLTAASAAATGLPLAAIVLVAGLLVLAALYLAQRWLTRRMHRTVNGGLFLASLAGLVALVWMIIAVAAGRADMLNATEHGSAPAQTLAQADIGALQARGDETLNLISRTGDTGFQADFHAVQAKLGAQLTAADGGSASVAAARQDASTWITVDDKMEAYDQTYDYGAETQLAIGTGPGSSATLFGRLETDLGAAIAADQDTFSANAPDGQDTFTSLEIGVIVLALMMAAGCAWGLSSRLAEYR
jgi:hypothetical protein